MKIPMNNEHAEAHICLKLGITPEELARQRGEAMKHLEKAVVGIMEAGVHPIIFHASIAQVLDVSLSTLADTYKNN